MYHPLQRTLLNHLQELDHHFMCLDLSIVQSTEIQVRRLSSLNLSVECLRFTVERFTFSQEALPTIIHEELCSQIMTIADIAQFLLYQCANEWKPDSIHYLEVFILTLQQVFDDVEAYKSRGEVSAQG